MCLFVDISQYPQSKYIKLKNIDNSARMVVIEKCRDSMAVRTELFILQFIIQYIVRC